MKLTGDQRNAVQHKSHTLIVACPGSGKTRTLIAKLLSCLEEVRDSPRRLACITYTNAAVYEIENRLKIYGKCGDEEYCDISTIHAFCLHNILQYFYWKIPEYEDGFIVLPPDSETYRTTIFSICDDYGLSIPANQDYFELLNRRPDGSPIIPEGSGISNEAAISFWDNLQRNKYIDFPNIIYHSYNLLTNFSSIAHAIACKFAWFLIDEFQDTSELQVEILRKIAGRNKTKFFLVGDPLQSIYGFAGARPDLMDQFAQQINANIDFKLLSNFRSSKPIIHHAEQLCPRRPPMSAEGDSTKFIEEPLYIHCATAFEAIRDHFIPAIDTLKINLGQTAILSPWWIKLLWLGRRLREYGIPIIGPGARPYRRNHLFALLAEHICAYIEYPDSKILYRIERELFNLVNNITGCVNFSIFAYSGRVVVYKLINEGINLLHKNTNAVIWLKEAANSFADILIKHELLPHSSKQLITESAAAMENDIINNGVDIKNLSISDIGIFANPEKNMKLLTMHGAKGREFDGVAIVDLHEGRVPHFSARTVERIEESRRLFYVSITRARRLLMYITDEERQDNTPSRFLCGEGLNLIN